jgi:endo-1,4-beta-xylanase
MQNHIHNVLTHYGKRYFCWDVVNEAISDVETFWDESNIWYQDNPDWVYDAFAQAGKSRVDSSVKLFYNDYGAEAITGYSQVKAGKVFSLIQLIQSRNIPIDGVGLQMHVDIDYALIDGVKANMAKYNSIGILVHITELDVRTNGRNDTEAAEMQAEVYAALLEACLEAPNWYIRRGHVTSYFINLPSPT